MRTYKPLWQEGLVLSQQHFHQQDRWWAYSQQQFAPLAVAAPWGVHQAIVDTEALGIGRLKLLELKLRLRDGTPIDTSIADTLPPARDLARDIPADVQSVTVLAALPLFNAKGNNCQLHDAPLAYPRRYFREYVQVPDLHGDFEAEMAVERLAVRLLFDFEPHSNDVVCPVARLVRGTHGIFELDPTYVAPCLTLSGHIRHQERVSRIADILLAKATALAARRRERVDQVAEFGVSDVSLFWLLHCIHTHWPDLLFFVHHPYQPPERLYKVLARLTGALMTFSTGTALTEIAPYDHTNQDEIFGKLESLIRGLLDAVIPSRVIPIGLTKKTQSTWVGQFEDERLLEGADYYLSVNAPMPALELIELIPKLCKIGAPDDITYIVNAALPGVPIKPVQRVPAAIPVRLENQYFALDARDAAHARMLAAHACQIYLPNAVPGASLELYAVLTS